MTREVDIPFGYNPPIEHFYPILNSWNGAANLGSFDFAAVIIALRKYCHHLSQLLSNIPLFGFHDLVSAYALGLLYHAFLE